MRTLIILGHPDKNSFTSKLADAYENGAKEKGGDVMRLNLVELRFDPILRKGYKGIQALEPDLVEAQRLLKWANHVVFVFPLWWSSPPALLKGFIERVFLPDFAYKYRENSANWDKLLAGRSSRLIMASDAAIVWPIISSLHPAVSMMKKATLEFCGIRPVSVTSFGSLKTANEKKREQILYDAYRIGLNDN
ncbi:MAG: NAD(P)H-dependent oxidoreductase [Bacteriovorax sp.]|jgi:putative NADPH-quinone reductase